MSPVKAVVLYPHPEDKELFEQRYTDEHMPLCQQKLPHMTRFVMTPVLGTPRGKAPYYKIVEMHFASMEDLQADFGAEGGKATAVHAAEISTGGPPTVLICGADQIL
jgi:uncharacterized protein (TIGR02118 family)